MLPAEGPICGRVTSLWRANWLGTLLAQATVASPDNVRQQTGIATCKGNPSRIQETIFELLTEQHETYRVLEERDTPVLQVLDPAVAPEKRYRPVRWMICVIATLLAFLFACVLAWVLDGIDRMRRDDPEQWRTVQGMLHALHPVRWFSSGSDPPRP